MYLGISTILLVATSCSAGLVSSVSSHSLITHHRRQTHQTILPNINEVPAFKVLAFAGPVRRYTTKIVSASGYAASAPGVGIEGRYVPDNSEKLYDDGSYKPDHLEKFYDDGSYKGEKIYWYKGKRIYW